MSIQIDHGLFTLGMVDYHAILGVPVTADAKQVRKPYLKIVRRLHPDSLTHETDAAKRRASELLSKLVNPAYERLSNEKEVAEYGLLLRLKGQQLQRQAETLQLMSEEARQLTSASNVDHAYHNALKLLSAQQYESLDSVLAMTSKISELNLVYVMRTAGGKIEAKSRPPAAAPDSNAPAPAEGTAAGQSYKPQAAETNSQSRAASLLENYLRRAEELELRKDYPRAVQELREALKTNPGSAECHSRLGYIYISSNQPTMAKIHFNKALELSPKYGPALEGKQKLGKILAKNQQTATGKSTKSTQKAPPDDKNSAGGGFFGLFGGKKK